MEWAVFRKEMFLQVCFYVTSRRTVSMCIYVFNQDDVCLYVSGGAMQHAPPCTHLTNTPLSVKHADMTEQPTFEFTALSTQSKQCFSTERNRHTLIQTQTLSPSADSDSKNSTAPCRSLSNYILWANLHLVSSEAFQVPCGRSALSEKWKSQSL